MDVIKAKKRHKITVGTSWLILVPSILLFAFFVWVPLIQNVILSFFDTKGTFSPQEFIGFGNYALVFADYRFITALQNTLMYTFWSLVIGFIVPIILAILVSEIVHFRGFFRAGFYLPNIIPGIAAVIMWRVMMDSNPYGFFNVLLSYIGIDPQPWLSSKDAAIPLMILTMTWKGAGATMLIYLASIQTIDPAQYEVAKLEGAGFFERIRYITIPALMGNIKLLLIMQIISVFQVFYEPLVLTGGGPNNATLSLILLIYNYAYSGTINAGKSMALGVIVSVILIGFTAVYQFASKERKIHDAIKR